MANLKNGRMFSAEFNKATEVNRQTRLLAQTPNEPVEYVDLEQVAEVVNEGMLSEQEAADTYATKTGEYKELTAGFAYEILGDGQATSEEFSFRPTGGPNRNVRDGSARIEVLKGNSVVWNQLLGIVSILNIPEGLTVTLNEDGSVTINGTVTERSFFSYNAPFTILGGHKYLLTSSNNVSNTYFQIVSNKTPNFVEGFVTAQGDESLNYARQVFSAGATFNNVVVRPRIYDLTKMFGAGNEPTTVEQFYEMLPIVANPNAYNTGEIVDANYKAIKTTAFNQWDEQWEVGGFNTDTGNPVNSQTIRSKNIIKTLPNMTYFATFPYITNVVMYVFAYDSNDKFIKRIVALQKSKFTTPSNCSYIKFYMQQSYGTTYKNDICVNIVWDEYSALNGEYKPYKPFERDLSWANKYFPNGMRSAGNVADEIRFNSTTQQWEAVQNVGVRAYQSGDEADTAVTTDGKNTNYALATPIVTPITEDVNLAYDVADYGTEQLIVAEGAQSAPLSAEVVYEPNVLASIKQVAAMLTRLDALETAVATMRASAIATTNEE